MRPEVEVVRKEQGWLVKVEFFTNRHWYFEKSHAFERFFACEVRAKQFAEEAKKMTLIKVRKMVEAGWIKRLYG